MQATGDVDGGGACEITRHRAKGGFAWFRSSARNKVWHRACESKSGRQPQGLPPSDNRSAMHPRNSWFYRASKKVSHLAGRPVTFAAAALTVLAWGLLGSVFGFSDTWQLFINTGTTIITFLMVFLIQGSQNSDTEALQIKLDELIRVQKSANNALLDLEDLDADELDKIRAEFVRLAEEKRKHADGDSSMR